MARRGVYVCAREACMEVFTRAPRDARRARHPVCSLRCRDLMTSERVTKVKVVCAGCAAWFLLLPGEARKRHGRLFCGRPCAIAHTDFRAMGRLSARSPRRDVSQEAKERRSSLGGRARARSLSPERLREIAMLGVKARQARASEDRAAWYRRGGSTRKAQRARFPGLFGRAPSRYRLRGKVRSVLLAGITKDE